MDQFPWSGIFGPLLRGSAFISQYAIIYTAQHVGKCQLYNERFEYSLMKYTVSLRPPPPPPTHTHRHTHTQQGMCCACPVWLAVGGFPLYVLVHMYMLFICNSFWLCVIWSDLPSVARLLQRQSPQQSGQSGCGPSFTSSRK